MKAINQEKPKLEAQVLYLGRWVPRIHFRAFVFNGDEKKLVNSYEEFLQLTSSGIWHAEKKNIIQEQPKSVIDLHETQQENKRNRRGRPSLNLVNQT